MNIFDLTKIITNTRKFLIPICFFSILVGCKENSHTPALPYDYQPPELLADGWMVADAKQYGFDVKFFEDMMNEINNRTYTGIDSIVVVHDGRIIHDAYFNGYSENDLHDMRSATKSITSALIGIAIDNQYLSSVEESVLPFFSQYNEFDNWDDLKDDILVKHLLTMSSGLECNDQDLSSQGNEERMYLTADWVKFVLDLPIQEEPGHQFSYCTGGVVTLGAIIEKVTGEKADVFSQRHLFSPLEINDFKWEYTPVGQIDTGGHLHLKPRDMAKIGQLFLSGGLWNNERFLSNAWIDESTKFQIEADNTLPYGYLWWRGIFNINGVEVPTYYASGNGGQFIFVLPSIDMVAVFTGSNYNSSKSQQPFEIIGRFLLRAVLFSQG